MEIVLARAGHYFNAGSGSCSTATVAHVNDDGTVNLSVLKVDGTPYSRTDVLVKADASREDTTSSFHLTRDCPWER